MHSDALTLVNTLHLLALCRLAVRLAYHRCPPPLPSLVQEGHLERTAKHPCCAFRSCGRCGDSRDLDMRDWLRSWPALALACGLRAFAKMDIPAFPALHSNASAGNKQEPHCRKLSRILSVLTAIRSRLIGARDLSIDSAPILAWHRADPDAADRARACSTSPCALDVCYRVHTLICRGSGLPLFFLLSPANAHDAPFARPLLVWAVRLYQIRPRFIRLDAASVGIASHHLDSCDGWRAVAVIRLPSQAAEEPLLFASYLDQGGIGQTQWH